MLKDWCDGIPDNTREVQVGPHAMALFEKEKKTEPYVLVTLSVITGYK